MRELKGQPRGLDGANENAQRASRWSAAVGTCGNLAGGLAQRNTPPGEGGNSDVLHVAHRHVLYY